MEIILLCCEKYNFSTKILTNGTLLNESLIKELPKFRIRNLSFYISLEGIGEINDEIRGKGMFEKVDRTIKFLKKYNFDVVINSTINARNINHYKELINYCDLLNIPCNFSLFKPFKDTHKPFIVSQSQYFKFAEDLFKLKRRYDIDLRLTNVAITSWMINRKIQNECEAAMKDFFIDVEGRMTPCYFLLESGYYDKIKLPKFDENFINTWRNNRYFQEFRHGNLLECQTQAYLFGKNIKGKDPYGIGTFLKYKKSRNIIAPHK